jgi:hypothetical protein
MIVRPRATVTGSPCDALIQARQQMYLLASGQAVVSIDTPQLGRVEYSRGSIADLQRLIDSLAAQCAEATGNASAGMRRKPINIEAAP